MNNDTCIVGYGVVGRATAKAFGITKYYSRSESNMTLKDVRNCRYVFICLPTPTVEGRCDTSAITTFINEVRAIPAENETIFIIRSTVYPGFNKLLQKLYRVENGINMFSFVSNPEFLSEDTAEYDAKNPAIVVLGGDEASSLEAVKGIYMGRFKYFGAVITDSITAETIKYALNTFFATKVIFANQLYDFAQKNGVNYETVKDVLEKHPWGSRNHFTVWYKGKRGVHGKCLPKDTTAFASHTGSKLLKTVMEVNEDLKS